MPIVTIQLTREGSGPGRDAVTAEEKATLIQYLFKTYGKR